MKEDQRKEAKMTELINQLESHPLTKKIMADWNVETLARRQTAANEILSLRKQQGEIIPRLQADLDVKEAKYNTARAAMDAAGSEFQTTRAVLFNENNNFDVALRNYESFLLETSDPLIDEAITFFREKHETLLHKSIDKDRYKGETNIFTMSKTMVTRSNVAAIKDALAYCLGAISRLQSMKLAPAPDLELITELKRGIPDTGVMEEVTTGDLPLPGINTDPRTGLKSDSEMDWTIGKLNQKFKKLMARK